MPIARIVNSSYSAPLPLVESLVRNVSCEEPSECRKGVRKNLGGKLRRLIKKKPQQEAYTIPAELRDQLKQIYVY
ncbi:unnamed protein product [Bemisia tabaci]|uniref:Uncharacterized protein n=1 Tax=Bemisia tabaci TaxID=7038 RepID=A0A9P0A9Z4_BEMTA|nr:unnamed protein product [Bemisia tabaci]